MREILFHGKRLDNGEWVEGFYYANPAFDRRLYGERHWIISGKNGLSYEVDPTTVGQFTGLLDKNGKRIFEGDILSMRTSSAHEVKFGDGWFYMEETAIPFKYAGKFAKIGNIYDTPELL